MRIVAIIFLLLFTANCVGHVPRTARSPGHAEVTKSPRLSVYRPTGQGPWPVALLLPGGRGAVEIGKAWPSFHRYAERLADRGILAAVVDCARADRGFWDDRRLVDLGRAMDEVRKLPGGDSKRLLVLGFSIGGAYALRLAGSRNDIAGLVTFFAPVEFPGVPDTEQPIASVPHLHCPVLILQGSADVITRPDHADRLLAALQEHHRDGRLEKLRRQGHGFTYEAAPMGTCCNFSESATARSVDWVVEFAAQLPNGGAQVIPDKPAREDASSPSSR